MLPRFTRPDYGASASQLSSPDIDAAELAARLGAVSRIRRSGRVLVSDDFTYSTGFQFGTPGGTGSAWGLSSGIDVYSPPTCGVLTAGTTLPFNAETFKTIPLMDERRVGVEFVFRNTAPAAGYTFEFDCTRFLTNVRVAKLRLDFNNGLLQYLDSAGAWGDIASIDFPGATWMAIKAVFDFTTFKYVTVFLNNKSYSNFYSGVFQSLVSTGNNYRVRFKVIDTSARGLQVWIDDFVFTIDEP